MSTLKLTPQQVAAWARQRAQFYNEFADSLESEFGATPVPTEPPDVPRNGTVTMEQFEDSVRKKSGRVKDLADRFRVLPRVIEDLLKQPGSKVYPAERGWLKVKD